MRIAIETLGTRGDVQPYVALALQLTRDGHVVQLAAPQQFESFVIAHGVPFTPLPGEFLALLDTPEGKAAIDGGQGFSAGFKLLKHVKPLMQKLFEAEWTAISAFMPDAVLYHPKAIAVPHIAERLDVPTILVSPLPGFTPTSVFASPMLPVGSLGPLNRASHLLAIHGAQVLFGSLLRQFRTEKLGLSKRGSGVAPRATVYGYSRHVVPVPKDWPANVLVSGYWFLNEGETWQMPGELAAFLADGEKPIYVGFGSMPGLDPQTFTQAVVEGLAKAGKRGLLATGGGALAISDLPAHVHAIASAPHDALFGYVSAALHHGGAGTTGASLRAGLPTIICPFFGDQPFWGRQVASLGAGPAPLNRKKLTAGALADAFKAADDPGMRAKAQSLGEAIRLERGSAVASNFVSLHGRRPPAN